MVLPFFVPLFSCQSYWRWWGGDRPTPIDPHESGGGGRSLDLRTTQRHEVEPAFKLTMVVKNRPSHPYIRWIRWIRTMMQLCASKARLRSSSSPFFFPVEKPWGDGGLPLPRIVFWPFRRYARRGAKTSYFFFLPVADYVAECSLKPSGMTPSFA